MKTFNVIEYLKKEPFDMDEFLVMMGRAELLSREEEKTLVASNRKAMEEDVDAFKARNADRKKAVLQFSAKTVAKTPAQAQ